VKACGPLALAQPLILQPSDRQGVLAGLFS
jgi:hypothetical protein